jgi:hypothetical protein
MTNLDKDFWRCFKYRQHTTRASAVMLGYEVLSVFSFSSSCTYSLRAHIVLLCGTPTPFPDSSVRSPEDEHLSEWLFMVGRRFRFTRWGWA